MSKLYFKYGCMGSSKSMDLLRTAHNYKQLGLNVEIIKPAIDTRDENVVRSRIGIEMPCTLFGIEENIYDMVRYMINCPISGKSINCLLVDEAQFLSKEQVRQLWSIVQELDIPVIAYGLRIDYRGEGFEASKELMTLAHSIEELKTICGCGKKATHHLLRVNGEYTFDGEGIHIGDTEFQSVCGKCWLEAYNKSLTGK